MHTGSNGIQIRTFKESIVFRFADCPGILLFKHQSKFSLLRIAVVIVPAIIGHPIDKKQTEHLDAVRTQAHLFIQMLLDGLADLQELVFVRVNFANGLTQFQNFRLTGEADVFVAFFAVDILNDISIINVTPAAVFSVQKISAAWGHYGLSLDVAILHTAIDLDLGSDWALFIVNAQKLNVGLIMAVFDFNPGNLDLLYQFLLIGINRVQFVEHVMLVHMCGRVTQRAERIE